jgi:DNA ligase-1
VGDPTAPDAYRKTVSVVASDAKAIDGLTYWVFDYQTEGTFLERHRIAAMMVAAENDPRVRLVPQVLVETPEALEALEAQWVGLGYEGVILRKPDSPYKHGRSTLKEGYLLKLKRFVDGEAVVIGVTELMHNENEAKTNELGRTARSHKKAGLVGAGVMGTLVVRDTKTGVEFEIGTGFTAQDRAAIWQEREYKDDPEVNYFAPIGRLAKYKHFPVGAKDKPRHPVFLGWRDKRDMDA